MEKSINSPNFPDTLLLPSNLEQAREDEGQPVSPDAKPYSS